MGPAATHSERADGPSSAVLLFVGIMSHRSPTALGRRHAIRATIPRTPRASYAFVMSNSTPDEDCQLPDIVSLHVRESGRILGTYLLTNEFFRYAVALTPRIPFIGRADDDALFDLPVILAEMASSMCSVEDPKFDEAAYFSTPFRPPICAVVKNSTTMHGASSSFEHCSSTDDRNGSVTPCLEATRDYTGAVIYGHFIEWSLWSPSSMQSACFDFSSVRAIESLKRLRLHISLGTVSTDMPRFERECVYSGLVGPFPFAKGPLVVYSHTVLATLVRSAQLKVDEAYALNERKRTMLRNHVTGRFSWPGAAEHPRRVIVFDDIYYSYLALRLYANKPLALVHARIAEYNKALPLRVDTHRGLVRVYHKLKTVERFQQINRSRLLMDALRNKVHSRYTCRTRWSLINPGAGWLVRGLSEVDENAGVGTGTGTARTGARARGPDRTALVLANVSGKPALRRANSSKEQYLTEILSQTAPVELTRCCQQWKFCH